MNRRTANALEASIAHWDANAKAQTPYDASVYCADCALCKMFYLVTRTCKGCPVERRGHSGCNDTPYDEASDIYHDWREGEARASAFHKAAIAERDFLISLREPIDEEAAHSTEAP